MALRVLDIFVKSSGKLSLKNVREDRGVLGGIMGGLRRTIAWLEGRLHEPQR